MIFNFDTIPYNIMNRGKLIVFEGLDKSGKTTQSNKLVSYLNSIKKSSIILAFPQPLSPIGKIIRKTLANEISLDEKALYLLFAADRYTCIDTIKNNLDKGINVILDRYFYSGIAYGMAKGLEFEWCNTIESKLLTPDIVIFLDINPESASKRIDYGHDNLENITLQKRISDNYTKIADNFCVIDAELDKTEIFYMIIALLYTHKIL